MPFVQGWHPGSVDSSPILVNGKANSETSFPNRARGRRRLTAMETASARCRHRRGPSRVDCRAYWIFCITQPSHFRDGPRPGSYLEQEKADSDSQTDFWKTWL